MIKTFFEGRLGADAELRTSQNGSQFYAMRVATDDYKNGENVTIWVNVRVGTERVGNMKFTKGSHVLVGGTLRASTYQTKNGETAVSIDVTADSINYIKGGTSGGTQTNETVTDTGKFTNTKKEEPATVAAASESTDDLPF